MTSCGLSGDRLPRRVINPCTPDYDKKNAERAFRGGNQASCSEECKALLVKNGRCVSVNVLFPLAARCIVVESSTIVTTDSPRAYDSPCNNNTRSCSRLLPAVGIELHCCAQGYRLRALHTGASWGLWQRERKNGRVAAVPRAWICLWITTIRVSQHSTSLIEC